MLKQWMTWVKNLVNNNIKMGLMIFLIIKKYKIIKKNKKL